MLGKSPLGRSMPRRGSKNKNKQPKQKSINQYFPANPGVPQSIPKQQKLKLKLRKKQRRSKEQDPQPAFPSKISACTLTHSTTSSSSHKDNSELLLMTFAFLTATRPLSELRTAISLRLNRLCAAGCWYGRSATGRHDCSRVCFCLFVCLVVL